MAIFKVGNIDFLVDEEDIPLLSKRKWRLSTNGRPISSVRVDGKKRTILMHRFINKTDHGLFTDHINGDYRDNRKQNLRAATPQQNQWNRRPGGLSKTGIKGVGFCLQTKKWKVSICIGGKRKTIGRFVCLGSAINAYNNIASMHHGKFARLNKRRA